MTVTDANRPRHARPEPEFDREFDLYDEGSTDRGFNDDRASHVADFGNDDAGNGAGYRGKSWRTEAPAAGAAGLGAAGVGAAGSASASANTDRGTFGESNSRADEYSFVKDNAAAAPASGAGASAAEPEHQGPPLRGLAMILLAVSVLLIGWAGFSIFGDKDGDDSKNTAQNQTTQNSGQPEQANPAGQPGQATPGAPGADNRKPGENRDGAGNPEDRNKPANPDEPKPGQASPANRGQNAPGAPAGNPGGPAQGVVNKESEYVTVLNNSPIRGLAGDTANKLKGQQWAKTGFGNLADTSGTFPKSVVLYPEDNANARAAAERIASDLGLKAQPRDGRVDETLRGAKMLEGDAPGAVVVITTNDMPR